MPVGGGCGVGGGAWRCERFHDYTCTGGRALSNEDGTLRARAAWRSISGTDDTRIDEPHTCRWAWVKRVGERSG